jgi:UDP-N-acetylmuramate dehydrogenase
MMTRTPTSQSPFSALPSALGSKWSTYKLGGPIDHLARPTTTDQAIGYLQQAINVAVPVTVVGWGSNSIIADPGIRGLTVLTRDLQHMAIDANTGVADLGAGLFLGTASTQLQKKGLGGGAFWVGIPGTVGGAVAMNAGAMGSDTAKHLIDATVYNLATQQAEVWDKARLQFAYRHSAINPQQHVVLSARFAFIPLETQSLRDELAQQMKANIDFRRQHHPTQPNGGSVFQNPNPDNPVGRLLDQLGARDPETGWREGGIRISPVHANFMINTGTGTATDLLRLMVRAKRAVKQHFGFTIHPENRFLGQPSAEEKDLLAELEPSRQ